MWLVANDIIIGVAFGSFLISNNQYMAEVLQRYVKVALVCPTRL
jgi:hypothetical protein